MGVQRHLLSPGDTIAKMLAFGLPDGKFTDEPLYPDVFTLSPQPVTRRYAGMCATKMGSLAPGGRPSAFSPALSPLQ